MRGTDTRPRGSTVIESRLDLSDFRPMGSHVLGWPIANIYAQFMCRSQRKVRVPADFAGHQDRISLAGFNNLGGLRRCGYESDRRGDYMGTFFHECRERHL
ncbi:MAG: hypothetical protein QOE16_1659, partial [Microbacteriaceae bacterium]|nr:hypothetical protein [Microbacteriaceae bacterium]